MTNDKPRMRRSRRLEENLHRKLNDAIGRNGVMKSVDLADAVADARVRPLRTVADIQADTLPWRSTLPPRRSVRPGSIELGATKRGAKSGFEFSSQRDPQVDIACFIS